MYETLALDLLEVLIHLPLGNEFDIAKRFVSISFDTEAIFN